MSRDPESGFFQVEGERIFKTAVQQFARFRRQRVESIAKSPLKDWQPESAFECNGVVVPFLAQLYFGEQEPYGSDRSSLCRR